MTVRVIMETRRDGVGVSETLNATFHDCQHWHRTQTVVGTLGAALLPGCQYPLVSSTDSTHRCFVCTISNLILKVTLSGVGGVSRRTSNVVRRYIYHTTPNKSKRIIAHVSRRKGIWNDGRARVFGAERVFFHVLHVSRQLRKFCRRRPGRFVQLDTQFSFGYSAHATNRTEMYCERSVETKTSVARVHDCSRESCGRQRREFHRVRKELHFASSSETLDNSSSSKGTF